MSSRNAERRPRQDAQAANRTEPRSCSQSTAPGEDSVLVAPAVLYLPAGRAKLPWAVARCPICMKGHRHLLGGIAASYQRSPSCKPSVVYTVKVTRIVPDVVVPIQHAVAS